MIRKTNMIAVTLSLTVMLQITAAMKRKRSRSSESGSKFNERRLKRLKHGSGPGDKVREEMKLILDSPDSSKDEEVTQPETTCQFCDVGDDYNMERNEGLLFNGTYEIKCEGGHVHKFANGDTRKFHLQCLIGYLKNKECDTKGCKHKIAQLVPHIVCACTLKCLPGQCTGYDLSKSTAAKVSKLMQAWYDQKSNSQAGHDFRKARLDAIYSDAYQTALQSQYIIERIKQCRVIHPNRFRPFQFRADYVKNVKKLKSEIKAEWKKHCSRITVEMKRSEQELCKSAQYSIEAQDILTKGCEKYYQDLIYQHYRVVANLQERLNNLTEMGLPKLGNFCSGISGATATKADFKGKQLKE